MYRPLVDIEADGPEWLEWSAALYESLAADREWSDAVIPPGMTVSDYGRLLHWFGRYCDAATRVSEDLERAIYESAPENDEYAWRLRQCDWRA